MSEIKFTDCKIMNDGDYWLCLKIKDIAKARHITDEIHTTVADYVASIKQYREKRSLNANAYAWKLITEIANVLRADKNEIYIQMLHRYGQSQIVSVIAEASDQFKRAIKYYDDVGESVLNGKLFKHIRVYTGSSEYDTREMAILIDGIVSECKQLGIETATPEEQARMVEDWRS